LEERTLTTGKFFLCFAWGLSLCFQIGTAFMEHYQPASLILCVLTLAIWGLICRFDELERQIACHVPETRPKPELEPEELS
jgi:hypothetical protein